MPIRTPRQHTTYRHRTLFVNVSQMYTLHVPRNHWSVCMDSKLLKDDRVRRVYIVRDLNRKHK